MSTFNTYSAGSVVVNNYFEGPGTNQTAVGNWVSGTSGTQDVFYGNISRLFEHCLYIQNTAPTIKWVMNNVFQEHISDNGNGRPIHAYTETNNKMENMKFFYNMVRDGEFLIATYENNTPIKGMQITDNILYRGNLRVGYHMMGQYDIQNNRIFHGNIPDSDGGILQHHFIWGAETGYTPCYTFPSVPNIVKGNIFDDGSVNYFTFREVVGIGGCHQRAVC